MYCYCFYWNLILQVIKILNSVLFIDNDCLVNIFDDIYHADKNILDEVITYLSLQFDQIWVPRTVEHEFYLKHDDKKRKKIFASVLNTYRFVRRCPVKVSKAEIRQIVGNTEENAGETDALIQINKTKLSERFRINRVTFFSQDRGALNNAQTAGVQTLDYRTLSNVMRETGIVLP